MARERIHPEGSDATYRVQESLKALIQQGGARKTFRLKPEANRALQALVQHLGVRTETEAVEAALIALCDQLAPKRPAPVAKKQRRANSALRLVK